MTDEAVKPELDPRMVWDIIKREQWRKVDDETFDAILGRIVGHTAAFAEQTESASFETSVIVAGASADDTTELREALLTPRFDGTDEGVHRALEGAGAEAAAQGLLPYAAFVIVESWEGDPEGKDVRREVLVTSGATVDGRRNSALQPITRAEGGAMRIGEAENVITAGDAAVPWDTLLDDFFRGYFLARVAADEARGAEADAAGEAPAE